jgi:hypothetical protein
MLRQMKSAIHRNVIESSFGNGARSLATAEAKSDHTDVALQIQQDGLVEHIPIKSQTVLYDECLSDRNCFQRAQSYRSVVTFAKPSPPMGTSALN